MAIRQKFNFAMDVNKSKTDLPNEQKQKDKEEIISSPEQSKNPSSSLGELVSKLESHIPKAYDVKFIPREKIQFHKDNDYPQDEIEKRADSILKNRLIHALEGTYDLDSDTYCLESGESRCRAIDYLINKYSNWENKDDYEYKLYVENVKYFEINGYPMNVILPKGVSKEEDEIDSKIRVKVANEDQRAFNAQRRAQAILELDKLYKNKNEILSKRGEKQINVNNQIAEDYNLTPRNVMYYKKTENLIPELQQEFNKNNLTLVDSANISALTEEEQRQIYELIQSGSNKKEISELTKQLNAARIEADNTKKEISKLQDTLLKKEKELQTEKESVEIKISKVKEEITKELEASDPNKNVIEDLNKKLHMLEDKELNLESEKKEFLVTAAKQNSKINALEEEVRNLKNSQINTDKPTVDKKSKDLMKEELLLRNTYNDCLANINNLLASYRRYEKIYDADAVNDLDLSSIEDIKEKIAKLAVKIKI